MTESWHDVANKRADRVRELEAELLGCRQARSELEAEVNRVTRDRDLYIHDLEAVRAKLDTQFMWTNMEKARAEKAEARVAELTRALSIHHQHEHPEGTCAYCRDAREREADPLWEAQPSRNDEGDV